MAQLDNIPAMLQSGEYVVRKEAVDKLGKDTMDMINNVDRLGYMGGGLVPQGEHGHSAIDELLALNTLANQRSVDMTRDSAMMNKGGKAISGKASGQPQSLDELIQLYKNQYGGYAPMSLYIRQLQGLQNPEQDILAEILGKTPLFDDKPDLFRYDPERFKEQMEGLKQGGKVLKKAPKGNKGLMNLPEEVRNRMGYMMEGGVMDNYMYGGMSKKKKKKGYEDGGSVGVVNEIGKSRKMFSDIDELLATAKLMDEYTFGPMQRQALRSMREAGMIDPKDTMEQVMMLLKAREQNKIPSFEKRKSYIMGGGAGGGYSPPEDTTTPSPTSYSSSLTGTGFGGGTGTGGGTVSTVPSSDFLERGFEIYGGRPEDEAILNRVRELFGFDPSVGAGEVQDIIGGYRSELTSFLPSVQQYGGGFEGFGGRQQAMQTARTGAYSGIDRAATDIASAEKDRQMAELIQYLTQLETQGQVEFT